MVWNGVVYTHTHTHTHTHITNVYTYIYIIHHMNIACIIYYICIICIIYVLQHIQLPKEKKHIYCLRRGAVTHSPFPLWLRCWLPFPPSSWVRGGPSKRCMRAFVFVCVRFEGGAYKGMSHICTNVPMCIHTSTCAYVHTCMHMCVYMINA